MTEVRSRHLAAERREEGASDDNLPRYESIRVDCDDDARMVGAISPLSAEDSLIEGAMIVAPKEESARIAHVSDDTLTACLTRIPAQMTPQQRMAAQQVCQIEETTRQLVPIWASLPAEQDDER